MQVHQFRGASDAEGHVVDRARPRRSRPKALGRAQIDGIAAGGNEARHGTFAGGFAIEVVLGQDNAGFIRMLGEPGDAANAAHRHSCRDVRWMKQGRCRKIVGADKLDDDAVGIAEAQHGLAEFAARHCGLEASRHRAGEPETHGLHRYGQADLEDLAYALAGHGRRPARPKR